MECTGIMDQWITWLTRLTQQEQWHCYIDHSIEIHHNWLSLLHRTVTLVCCLTLPSGRQWETQRDYMHWAWYQVYSWLLVTSTIDMYLTCEFSWEVPTLTSSLLYAMTVHVLYTEQRLLFKFHCVLLQYSYSMGAPHSVQMN